MNTPHPDAASARPVHAPERCIPADAGITMLPGLPSEDADALNAYFHPFAAPTVIVEGDRRRNYCLSCNGEIDGFKHALGLGVAMQWGLTHGEARCTACGWPARGIHYIKRKDGTEVCSIRNLFLQYHHDEVILATARTPATPDHGERADG